MGSIPMPSINSAMCKQACQSPMHQLGKVLPCLIATMAAVSPEHGPIFFAKWDIRDGFWQLMVRQEDAWNFCCMLPAKWGEPIQIMVPTSLQMGWCKSPPFFCTATKMAQDLAQQTTLDTSNPLPVHPLENLCMPLPEKLQPNPITHDATTDTSAQSIHQ